jgi:Ca-activated chloride channel homolog
VAEDVKPDVQFLSSVKNYRLIGFDNKAGAMADTSVKMEGRELGPAHAATAIFEIEPADSLINDIPLANIQIRYHLPGDEKMITGSVACHNNYKEFLLTDYAYQFASSVALMGMILRNSPLAKNKTMKMY